MQKTAGTRSQKSILLSAGYVKDCRKTGKPTEYIHRFDRERVREKEMDQLLINGKHEGSSNSVSFIKLMLFFCILICNISEISLLW